MDDLIIEFCNGIAESAEYFTSFMFAIVNNNLVKGGVIVAILWYLWFDERSNNLAGQTQIMKTLFSSVIAIVTGRALNNLLPYKPRPILNPEYDFSYQADDLSWLNQYSSFPSDHALLFFALATGIFLVSKKWGIVSYTYVLVVICFPRVYLGFHYFTDILAGAVVGIAITLIVSRLKPSKILAEKVIELSERYPGISYAIFFVLSYQMATLFTDARELISSTLNGILKIFG